MESGLEPRACMLSQVLNTLEEFVLLVLLVEFLLIHPGLRLVDLDFVTATHKLQEIDDVGGSQFWIALPVFVGEKRNRAC